MAGNGSARFPSTMRLKKKSEFVRVFREGTPWKGSCFSLHILPRTGGVLPQKPDLSLLQEAGPRLGMVVTRRVGSAVERNRIKRRIREAFRKSACLLPAVDLVIRPDAACKEIAEEQIAESLVNAVNKVLGSLKERT